MLDPQQELNWHTEDIGRVAQLLETDADRGLAEALAVARRSQVGPNELVERQGRRPWRILWEQLSSTMVLILIAAAVVSGLLGKPLETVAISSSTSA